jgi:hypothetical protein
MEAERTEVPAVLTRGRSCRQGRLSQLSSVRPSILEFYSFEWKVELDC